MPGSVCTKSRKGSLELSFGLHPAAALTISEKERQFVQQLFEQHDVNNSKTIDRNELHGIFRTLGTELTEEQLQDLMDQVDVNKSAAMNFHQFEKLFMLYKEAVQYSFLESAEKGQAKKDILSANNTGFMVPEDSMVKVVWQIVLSVATLYVAVEATLLMHVDSTLNFANGIVGTSFFFLDGVMSCITCVYTETGEISSDPSVALVRYMRTWLLPDVVALLPYEAIAELRPYSWLRLVKIPKVLLGFTTRRSGKVVVNELYVFLHYTVLFQVKLFFFLLCLLHLTAVGWMKLHDDDYTYDRAIYFVLYTVTTVGFGDENVDSKWKRIYCCMLFVISALLNGFVISSVGSFLSRTNIKDEQRGVMRETVAVLVSNHIPSDLRSEILSFQAHQLENNVISNHSAVIKNLPEEMRNNLELFIHIRMIECVPLFRRAHRGCKIVLAQCLVNEVFAPGQYVFLVGEQGHEMYFVGHGYLNVLHADGRTIATLQRGAFFGEVALLTDGLSANGGVRTASVKALSYCDLFRLDRKNFIQILKMFPRFQLDIKNAMRKRKNMDLPDMNMNDPDKMLTEAASLDGQSFYDAERSPQSRTREASIPKSTSCLSRLERQLSNQNMMKSLSNSTQREEANPTSNTLMPTTRTDVNPLSVPRPMFDSKGNGVKACDKVEELMSILDNLPSTTLTVGESPVLHHQELRKTSRQRDDISLYTLLAEMKEYIALKADEVKVAVQEETRKKKKARKRCSVANPNANTSSLPFSPEKDKAENSDDSNTQCQAPNETSCVSPTSRASHRSGAPVEDDDRTPPASPT
eukprot:Sspe_Gene.48541::Locus_25382_Transcript_1_2_Confidence_0.800_Length_2549::g.48541::m.48541/K04911/KCNH8; potassium voltage-gated channel Eag-related subfamily H member 8